MVASEEHLWELSAACDTRIVSEPHQASNTVMGFACCKGVCPGMEEASIRLKVSEEADGVTSALSFFELSGLRRWSQRKEIIIYGWSHKVLS